MVFEFAGQDVAVAVVNPRTNVFLVLSVRPDHRKHGLGSAIINYLQCNFARVIEAVVPFFERNGYRSVGQIKQGNRLKTQVMIKSSLASLAGRLARLHANFLTADKKTGPSTEAH